MHEETREPNEEELRAAFEEQLKRVKVQDVVLQTVATLVNLGGRRLGLAAAPGEDASEERDLEQARIAIEGVRALLPLCPEEQAEAVRGALSQLQMAYAREAQGAPAPAPGTEAAPDPGPAATGGEGGEDGDDAERARARSKIWTPPGA